jgi:hypothetical protein
MILPITTWLAQFSACLHPNVVPIMVQRRSKTSRSCSSSELPTTNQLVKPVSPFEELKTCEQEAAYPFDEQEVALVPPPTSHDIMPKKQVVQTHEVPKKHRSQARQDVPAGDREESDKRDAIPLEIYCAHQVPLVISVPTTPPDDDDDAELSVEEDFKEERALTPHPSFDDHQPTASDFHYLYQAAKKLEEQEQDWPSDEDGEPLRRDGFSFWANGPVHQRNLGQGRENAASKYRLV